MIPEKNYCVVIVAGGKGLRAGKALPKQFLPLNGKPLLMHTLCAFHECDYRLRIITVLPEGFLSYWQQLCREHLFSVPHEMVVGGETRFHSVKNGLNLVADDAIVAIHDGARPFVSPELIARCFDTAFEYRCGVIPVVKEVNTVRQLTENGSRILNRESLRIVQTPQVFPADKLKAAYETDFMPKFTDDASVAEHAGNHIELVDGDPVNIKITTPLDFTLAECYSQSLKKRGFF